MTPTLRQLVWRVLVPVLAIDQLIKVWIKTSFTVGERLDFVPGILELQFIENEGMAFGWALPGVAGKLLLTGFRLVAAVAIGVYISRRIKEKAPKGLLYSHLVWAGLWVTSLTARSTVEFLAVRDGAPWPRYGPPKAVTHRGFKETWWTCFISS